MTKRKGKYANYEKIFEDFLRRKKILYIAINEFKRPLFKNKKVKNFDFIINTKRGTFLLEVKGKQFPYVSSSGKNYWENWIVKDDILGLSIWSKKLKLPAFIVYVYFIKEKEELKYFKNIIEGKYGIVCISLENYLKYYKQI